MNVNVNGFGINLKTGWRYVLKRRNLSLKTGTDVLETHVRALYINPNNDNVHMYMWFNKILKRGVWISYVHRCMDRRNKLHLAPVECIVILGVTLIHLLIGSLDGYLAINACTVCTCPPIHHLGASQIYMRDNSVSLGVGRNVCMCVCVCTEWTSEKLNGERRNVQRNFEEITLGVLVIM